MSEDLKRLDRINQDGLVQVLKDLAHYKNAKDVHLDSIILDVEWLILQADKAVKHKKMYLDADEKQSEYWKYKIAFEKLVEVLNK